MNRSRRRGMALMIVILTLAALAILATPFVVSMQLQERSSRNAVGQARARYAVTAAYNHALAQLLAATNEYGELAVTFEGLGEGLEWRQNGRSVVLDARIDDEQGKLNLNTAPNGVIAQLLADEDLGLGYDNATGQLVAAAIQQYRTSDGWFPSLDSLRGRPFADDELDVLRPHVTVHSEIAEPMSESGDAFARVNLNTCSSAVLRATLAGVSAVYPEVVADDGNTGNGTLHAMPDNDSVSGVWTFECTSVTTDAATDAKRFTFVASGHPEDEPGSVTTCDPIVLTESPNQPADVTVDAKSGETTYALVSICNGTSDFAVGDTFTTTFEGFSYSGATCVPDKANALLARLRARVVSADTDASTITLDDASKFPTEGWVRIRGDLIRFTGRDGNTLQGCEDRVITPCAGEEVIRIVPDLAAFEAILNEAVDADELHPAHRDAILINARSPQVTIGRDTDAAFRLRGRTVGLCFRPTGRYTVQADARVNDAAGSETARKSVRRVVVVGETTDAGWTLDRQSQFDAIIKQRGLAGLLTTPQPTYIDSVAPSDQAGVAGVTLLPIDRGFRGETLGRAAKIDTIVPPVPGTSLTPGENFFLNGDPGLAISGARSFLTYAAPMNLYSGGGVRRLELWVKPVEGFAYGGDHVFFDCGPTAAGTDHVNRIRLWWSGTGGLRFRVAGEAAEGRSSEIRATVAPADFAVGSWHRIDAVWTGMDIDEIALFLNGTLIGTHAPDATAAVNAGPSAPTGSKWLARVANYINKEGVGPCRDTQAGTTLGPTSVYGYGACRFINKDASTRTASFNKLHRGASTLAQALPASARQATTVFSEFDAAALAVPLADASGFPDEGYVKVENEIIHYTARIQKTDTDGNVYWELTVPAGGRGQSFGDNAATRVATSAAVHAVDKPVLVVSVKVTSNADYPMPHYLPVPGDVEDYFGVSGDPNLCYIQVGEEWVGYTHRAGDAFLVHASLDPGNGSSTMRGGGGTTVAAHTSGDAVLPVYEVRGGGRLAGTDGNGGGDRVTLLDDGLAPEAAIERAILRASRSGSGYLVSFADLLPDTLSLYIKKGTPEPTVRNARLVKFPSSRYRPARLLAIGSPVSGAGSRADSVISRVHYTLQPGSLGNRIKEPVDGGAADGFEVLFGDLASLYNGGTEWGWTGPHFGVGSWPVSGIVNIGDEAFVFKTRYPHKVSHWSSEGAMSTSCSAEVRKAGGVGATGNIVWIRYDGGTDPITEGFNPNGGYLVIESYKRTSSTNPPNEPLTVTDPNVVTWLVESGRITQQFADDHYQAGPPAQWVFPALPGGGETVWNTSQAREYVFYSEIQPKTPGADEYTFVCDAAGRHQYDTHEDGEGNPLGHAPADDGEGGTLYPKLFGRTVAMTVLHRGGAPGRLALGTARSAQHAGRQILPLSHVPITMLSGRPLDPYNNDALPDEGDRLPVESHSHFPSSGYVEITDATGRREIIRYLGKTEAIVEGSQPERKRYFLTGIAAFRGRFGTRPIDLTDLAVFDDIRQTDAAQIAAYRDPRRVVRLIRPRIHDAMPLTITQNGGVEQSRQYKPFSRDNELVFFEAKRSIRGAKWLSLEWTETLPAGTDVIVLARIGDSPSWATGEAVMWNAVGEGSGRVVRKFDDPGASNTIHERGDSLTVRVFFKFTKDYDPSTWAAPVLHSLKVKYESLPGVIESAVLDY
jgi:type II secretory pathway component PulK